MTSDNTVHNDMILSDHDRMYFDVIRYSYRNFLSICDMVGFVNSSA